MLTYLRIAVTALSLTTCVLLIALWVRSYWYWDHLYNPIGNGNLIIIESSSSRVIVKLATGSGPWTWHISRELHGDYWAGAFKDWEEANRHKGIVGFACYATPWITTYRAPYWFLVLLSVTLAVIPWLPWSRRFSLRTLLIATTLIAIMLGVIAFKLNKPEEQPPIDVGDFGTPFEATR